MTVRLSKEQKIKILNSEDVFKIMQQILLRENKISRAHEHFWVIGLNNKNTLFFIELIGLGPQNRLLAKPPDIFRMAIYKLALKIILVHNHPSMETTPSKADINATSPIIKAGEVVQIQVIDHLIITEKEYFSFSDNGLLG